jgi:isoleucyl-tRNA synthetase
MRKKYFFEPVNINASFSDIEEKILDYWYKNGIDKKYREKNKNSEKYFSFLDGPITANNPMGVHHAWGRTYKDLWQRYKNMQGFKQRFQNGFDCQGLWVEVEVEKELGFKTKKDIERYGVDKFVEKCKERVLKFSSIQTEQSKRLGYFMDWDHSYYTMSEYNNYMIWHFLKVCYQNEWIYKGNDSVPWCPRCETAISQHEILTEDYKELTHTSIILKFPIKERRGEYLLVWTTTPWTIPANVAVAVDKDLDYALVEGEDGSLYWLAKDCIRRVFGKDKKPVKVVKGKKLVGLSYRSAFDDLPAVMKVSSHPKFHTVVATDDLIMPITTEEGTGLVHTAVSAGSEDYRLGQKIGLPMIPVINDDASYKEDLGVLSGKNAKKHPEIIFDYLEEKEKEGGNWVFIKFEYKHRYPVCWRCKEELVWKVTDEWYIAMDKPTKEGPSKGLTLRERMMKVAKKIKWIPSFGLKREIDWLKNMGDWLISKKNRYWGLALPIWECDKCGHFEVIGSKEELREKACEGWEKFDGHTPHKPHIDFVKINCPKCGNVISRIEPVGNPWLDAGIVSFSTISKDNVSEPLYLTDKNEWRKWFPADFITESFPGQFKNWFYSLIAMSTVLEDENPTKTILGFATLLAEDGRPMHKSWGNSIEFNEGAQKMGADVMRWIYARQNVSENLLFGYKLADEVRRKFHLKLWNTYNFLVTYANIDNWSPSLAKIEKEKLSVLDKWILLRLEELVNDVTKNLDSYNATSATLLIENFVDDLSNWYIRRSRDRVGLWADDKESKSAFYTTIYTVMENLIRIIAPFLPFLSEEIYRNITKKESVHLEDWPDISFPFLKEEKNLIENMAYLRSVVEKIHAKRKELNIPVRQPLFEVTFVSPDKKFEDISDDLIKIAQDELNVKSLIFKFSKEESIELNTKITPELEEEAKARELLRMVQEERKKMNISFTHPSVIYSPWQPKDKKLLETILRKSSSQKIIPSDTFRVEILNN